MSQLEEKLLEHIRAVGLPPPVREFAFAPGRRYRADLAWPDPAYRLLVECEGGTWNGGRHTSGAGFEADAEKYNLATILGFRTLRFTTNMIRDGRAVATIEQALGVGAPSLQALIARRMESYPRPIDGEGPYRRACQAAGISPIPAHPNGLTDPQAAAVLACLPDGGRRIWAHEVGEGQP